jgi:hypothetical protein
MKNSRRDVFKFAGGAVAGALLTPAPWRLITDSALWSENWPGIPRPARGEIRTKLTNCALCPAGCAVRARCVGDQPVSMAGAQCPFGLTAHHLPYHPARLRQGPVAEATAALAGRAKEDRIAVLDLNPGRTASWTLRRSVGALNGIYIAPEINPVAYDLQAARTVLSVGAPLLEGWGTPRNVIAARDNFHLVHAGAMESPTAMLADEWIRIPAGGEEAFIANLPPALLRRLRENGPSLVIGDAPGIDELNRQLHAPVYVRPEAPVPADHRSRRRTRPRHPPTVNRRVVAPQLHSVERDRAHPGPRQPRGSHVHHDTRRLRALREVRDAHRHLPRDHRRHSARHRPDRAVVPPGDPPGAAARRCD